MADIGTTIDQVNLEGVESKGAIVSPAFDTITPGVNAPAVPESGDFLPALYHAHNRYDAFVSVPHYIYRSFQAMDNLPQNDYNPFEGLDAKYAPFHSFLEDAKSPEERADILSYVDYKMYEKQVANSNLTANLIGTLAGAVATTLPTLAIGEMMWAANSIPSLALRGAVTGALIDVPVEAAMAATDPEFRMDEVWTGIALSALGGLVIEPLVAGSHAVKAPGTVAETVTTGEITAAAAHTVSEAAKKEMYSAVQMAEDGFKPSARITKSGSVSPDEYLKALTAEGLTPGTGPLGKLFDRFIASPLTDYQPNIVARLLKSDSAVTRQLTNSLAEHNFYVGKTGQGHTLTTSAESQIEANTIRQVSKLDTTVDDAFYAYKKAGGKGDQDLFEELAAKAARREDYSHPQVGKVAKYWNDLMEKYLADYKNVDLMKDLEIPFAKGSKYFTRVYDREKIVADPETFRTIIADAVRPAVEKGFKEAGDIATVGDIDKAVLKAVEDIRSNIMGNTYFDLEHLMWADKNGKTRVIDIPDTILEPFLKNNIKEIGKMYITRAEKSLALQQRFGTASKNKILQNVVDDYKGLMEGIDNPDQIAKLEEGLKKDLNNLEIIIDRLTGTRGQQKDPMSLSSKAVRFLLPYNMARGLGSIAITQMPELARATLQRYVVSSGVLKELESLGTAIDNLKLTKTEARELGAYLEHGQRLQFMAQGEPLLNDAFVKEISPIKAMTGASNFLAKYSGMQTMDNLTRGMLAESGLRLILNSAKAAKSGKLPKKQQVFLLNIGIEESMLPEIEHLMAKHSETIDGFKYANLDKWEGKTGDAVRAGIRQYFLSHIVRPGAADRFGFADSNNFGRIAMQFRSYAQAAWSRSLLPGMQKADAAFFGTLATMITTGYLVMRLKDIAMGKDRSKESTASTISDTINASGALPFLFDSYSVGMNTYLDPKNILLQQGNLPALFGPTASLIATAPPALARLAMNDLNPGDIRTLKSMVPFGNLIWWNWYVTELQKEKAAEISRQKQFDKLKP